MITKEYETSLFFIILGEKSEFHRKISESSHPASVYHCIRLNRKDLIFTVCLI